MEPIKLIVGLGNPGSEYARTRHNAGFWFVDALAEAYGGRFSGNRRLRAELAEVTIADMPLRLLKPQTFMNRSGEAIAAALRYFKIPTAGMLVGYDEIDFETGKVRLKFGGGHAGHNGIRNIIEHSGADFWRLRFGVGHPGDRHKVTGHVLKRASDDDERLILDGISRGIEALPTLLRDGPQRAQQALHTESEGGN